MARLSWLIINLLKDKIILGRTELTEFIFICISVFNLLSEMSFTEDHYLSVWPKLFLYYLCSFTHQGQHSEVVPSERQHRLTANVKSTVFYGYCSSPSYLGFLGEKISIDLSAR